MKKNSIAGALALLLCAFIWGTAFVAQSTAMDHMQPLTFQAARNLLGGAVLIPFIAVRDGIKKKQGKFEALGKKRKIRTLWVGIVCGVILFTASTLQQYGMALGTSSGNSGFITALYIIFVPVAGVIMRKKVPPVIWGCVALAIGGLWLLCVKDGFAVSIGDALTLACAVVFTIHIIAIDTLVPGIDGVTVSCIQFFTAAVISVAGMLIFETPSWEMVKSGIWSILYAGVLSSGIAYTLQIVGQQRCDPTVASLLMSFESVFAVLGTIAFTALTGDAQFPTSREWIGCALMFAAIIISQLPFDKIRTGLEKRNKA